MASTKPIEMAQPLCPTASLSLTSFNCCISTLCKKKKKNWEKNYDLNYMKKRCSLN